MKIVHTSGKRKQSVARATLREGKGIVRINGLLLDHWNPGLYQLKVREPMILAGGATSAIDVAIDVRGGGVASQADSCRLALARALVEHDNALEKVFLEYDRQLLVADVRRREPRKPNTHGKARSKRQKSYR
jgi:small subunit ribosomal protein S9